MAVDTISKLCITLTLSAVCGLLFLKCHVPGGMLVGAIFGASLLNLTVEGAYMPKLLKTTAQAIGGTFIGAMVDQSDLKKLKSIYKVAGVSLISFTVIQLIGGFIIYWLTPYDLLTALMCSIPGGLSDIPLIAEDLGADVAPVVFAHFLRAVVGIGIFPYFILKLAQKDNEKENLPVVDQEKACPTPTIPGQKEFIITVALTCFLGALGKVSGIPVGALVFFLIGIMVVKLCGFHAYLPKAVKRIAQILSGAYIGCSITKSSLYNINSMLVPTIILLMMYTVNIFVTGKFISKIFRLSERESMLMLTPAGAGDIALIQQDMGIGSSTMVFVHVIRLCVADTIFPQGCLLLVKMLGL